jgi:hypothetical protein
LSTSTAMSSNADDIVLGNFSHPAHTMGSCIWTHLANYPASYVTMTIQQQARYGRQYSFAGACRSSILSSHATIGRECTIFWITRIVSLEAAVTVTLQCRDYKYLSAIELVRASILHLLSTFVSQDLQRHSPCAVKLRYYATRRNHLRCSRNRYPPLPSVLPQ